MTTAPAADQHRLLEVQALDTRLDQLAHRRRTLPVLARLAEHAERAEALAIELLALRTKSGDIRRDVDKAEADVEQVRARARRDRERLQASGVSAKDVQALTHELETLERRQSELEDTELEIMEQLDEVEQRLTALEGAEAELAADREAALTERDEEFAALDAEASEVRAARDAIADELDPALMALYARLRDQHGGVGAARLVGSRCEGCHLDLNASDVATITRTGADEIVRCEECGRILVRNAT